MKNTKKVNIPNSNFLSEPTIFEELAFQKLKFKKTYYLKLLSLRNLIAHVGVYENDNLIFSSYLLLAQFNLIINSFDFQKKEILDILFDAREVQKDAI